MNNKLILIGFVLIILLIGCIQSNKNLQLDCGTDADCFQQTALNDCGKAKLNSSTQISGLFGADITFNMQFESRGKEENQCIYSQKWLSIEASFPPETQLTQEEKDQMVSSMKQFEGKEAICRLSKTEFENYIRKMVGFIKTGNATFSSDDLPADKCTGSFYELN